MRLNVAAGGEPQVRCIRDARLLPLHAHDRGLARFLRLPRRLPARDDREHRRAGARRDRAHRGSALRRLDAQARDLGGDRRPRSPARSSATTSASRSAATAGAKFLLRHGHKIRLHEGRLKIGIWLFRRHGGKVVFWGRFVSILRTWAAFLAGVNQMAVAPLPRLQRRRGDRLGHGLRRRVLRVRRRPEQAEHGDRRLARRRGVAIIVAFVVWSKRKEDELLERAARDIAGSVAEELGEDEPGA